MVLWSFLAQPYVTTFAACSALAYPNWATALSGHRATAARIADPLPAERTPLRARLEKMLHYAAPTRSSSRTMARMPEFM
jgi:hypothetical protein